jgi:tetratricopeptide (TPR) repeat protein
MGRYDDAKGYLEESLSIAREIGDKGRAAMVLEELGTVATGQGDPVTARSYFEQALLLAEEHGNPRTLAAANNALAQLCRMEGDLDTSEKLYEKMLTLSRRIEDRESIAVGLLNLSMVSIGRGLGDRARIMLLEALSIAGEIGSKPAGQSALEVSAGLGALRKEWERAARLFGAAEAQIAQTGLQRDPADEVFLGPLIVQVRSALGNDVFDKAATAGRALGYEEAMAEARAWLIHLR